MLAALPYSDSVLTSGCSFISQHIWIKICIVLAILGGCIRSKKFSAGKRSMWTCISGWQINDLKMLSSGSNTSWVWWCSQQTWCQLWSQLSMSLGQTCTYFFVSPACLRMFCSAILARKAFGHMVLMNHWQVSFYCSLHHVIPRILSTPLRLFSDVGAIFPDQILHFLTCGVQKPPYGHVAHIQGQPHVELFQLYLTSLPCHHSRHVENLQEIGCYFYKWDSAITSTFSASVASAMVIITRFVHWREYLSRNLSVKIPELTTLWDSILQTVWTNALVDHGGFLLRAAMNWLCSSQCSSTVCYMVNWQPFSTVWICSHPTACCFLLVLHPVLVMIFQCASWVIVLVAALAVLWWTNRCLHSSCVPMSAVFDEVPATSATTPVSVRNTRVFWMALTALTEPCTLWRRIWHFPSPRWWVALLTYFLYFAPGMRWRIRTIRTIRVLHTSQGLQLCCSHLHNAWRCLCLSSANSHMRHSDLCLALRFCHLLQ